MILSGFELLISHVEKFLEEISCTLVGVIMLHLKTSVGHICKERGYTHWSCRFIFLPVMYGDKRCNELCVYDV